MRKILVATVVFTALLAGETVDSIAAPMSLAAPGTAALSAARITAVQQATNICGSNGCVPVYTKRAPGRQGGSALLSKHI